MRRELVKVFACLLALTLSYLADHFVSLSIVSMLPVCWRSLVCVVVVITTVCLVPVWCDTWITLWNKLDVPLKIHCWREGAKKLRSFKNRYVEPDDRYDIKGKYPKKSHPRYHKHWCDVKVDNVSLKFDVFGGKDKRLNKMADSYSDWIINSAGVHRFKKGQLMLYYGKGWLGEVTSIEDDLAGTPEKELNPDDFVYIAPLEVDMKTAKMPLAEQRYAIDKATYASHKFENGKDMSRYVKAAMDKRFGGHWQTFVEQNESNKTVKLTCDAKNIMNFSINELNFIVCRVMR